MSAYIDTQVAIWLALGSLDQLTVTAKKHIQGAELLISPTVVLELEYLVEIGRFTLSARDIVRKLQHEIALRICDLSFPQIVEVSLDEKWTCDPFDRLIVAHAKANGMSVLISADRLIRQNYIRAVW